MESLLQQTSPEDYTLLNTLEQRYLSLNFINFFYQKLEMEYIPLLKRNIYGIVAEFRIICIQVHSRLSSTYLCHELLQKMSSLLQKVENSNIYSLLNAEYQTLVL